MATLIDQHVALQLRRPVLVRIHELSQGNPFYALEMARALARRGDREFRADAPLPDSLEALIHDRIDALSPAALDVALYAAALSPPTRAVLDAVLGADRVSEGVEAATGAGILEADGGGLRFTHPLLAAAIYRRATAERRLDVHRALAAAVADPEERARHLALAVDTPDAGVAAVLDDAASIARSRGAAAAAADLAEAAVRLTPLEDPAARLRRILAAADHHLTAGDVPLARSTLEGALVETGQEHRGAILAQLGLVDIFLGEMGPAGRAFEEALPLAGNDDALRSRIHMGLAGVAFLAGRIDAAGEAHIDAALANAEKSGDAPLILQAIGHFATWQFCLGRGTPPWLVERAASLEIVAIGGRPARAPGSSVRPQPSTAR